MKVVQVTAIEYTMVKLLKRLNESSVEKGIEVHCVSKKGNQQEELLQQGVHFHDVHIDRKISPISNVKSIYQMVKLFRQIRPDIVHVHTPVAAVLGRIAAKIARVPNIIYTAHGFYFHEGMSKKQYQLYFNIEKWIGRYFTDYIFTQSKEDYDVAVSHQFLKPQNNNHYVHISNGIDLENQFNLHHIDQSRIEALRQQYDIKDEDTVVSFIGRLVKEKGILDLLEAYQKLTSNNVKFVIIGSLPEGERDQETFEHIKKFEAETNIIFTGQVENINELLAMSDIFCLSSYREGMPRSIIEAMAMKNAIIATNIRGSREEVVDEQTGFLVPLNASAAIAQKIDELVNQPQLLRKFQNAGYERALKLFDEEKVVQKQLEIFENVNKQEKQ
ncbi:glycosyltransferase family 4 protein [Staphylococcus delphini]|uniref:glycosyltransferase family 4 protein n=1 Tax=Staphylococcus delphini TaxID=53344 RepID=UPI001CCB2134|nr:glycosyltransferase family 4 protein [Staphylococcus delphini]MBZ8174621.1 glycosyltransferase family 4 protein [Staphylococcus delphini]